jgi:hypothetical protein
LCKLIYTYIYRLNKLQIDQFHYKSTLVINNELTVTTLLKLEAVSTRAVSTRFPYQMMFVSFSSNTTGVTSGTGSATHFGAPAFTLGYSGVSVARSLVFCVVFCRLLPVLLYFVFAIVLSVIQLSMLA